MVRLCYFDDRKYKIFVNSIIANIDFKNKNELEKILRKVIKWLDDRYQICISGLFEVDIFVQEGVGIFIELEKISSIISRKDIDLKINVIYNCEFLFRTDFYDSIDDLNNVFYNQGYYYINTKDMYRILDFIEYGEIIYEPKLKINRDFIRIK